MVRFIGVAGCLVLLVPLTAQANWHSFYGRPTVSARSYYYPVPVYTLPVVYPTVVVPAQIYAPLPMAVAAPPLCPAPVMAVPGTEPPLAAPPSPVMPPAFSPITPAPPSSMPPAGTQTAPPMTGSAKVSDARYFDTYAVAMGSAPKPADGRCSVAFWNLTGQDVTLKVGTQTLPLARGKSATLELPREFTWQLDGRAAQSQSVAASETGLEIVVRR